MKEKFKWYHPFLEDIYKEQIIGSNIDTAFIVSGLDDNFNIGRFERYIL